MERNFLSTVPLKSQRIQRTVFNTLKEIYSQLTNLKFSDSFQKEVIKECDFILFKFIFLLFFKPSSFVFPNRHIYSTWKDIFNQYGNPLKVFQTIFPNSGVSIADDSVHEFECAIWLKNLEQIPWGDTADYLTRKFIWKMDYNTIKEGNQNLITLEIFDEFVLYLNDQRDKTKGLVYTPYPLALEIVEKSILNWIKAISPNFHSEELGENINVHLLNQGKHIKKLIFKKIKEIRILDPAMGTGVFLFAAANALLNIQTNLKSLNSLQKTKLRVLRENVFGIDIDPLALHISKLKFLLWIYSQNSQISLNKSDVNGFNFNIFRGNTLFGYQKSDEDIDLDHEYDLKLQKSFPIYELIVPIRNCHQQLDFLEKIFPKYSKNPLFKFFIIEGNRLQWNRLKNDLEEKVRRKIHYSLSNHKELHRFKIYAVFSELIPEHQITNDKSLAILKFHNIPLKFHWNDLGSSSFDLIVGNPPFIALTDLSLISRKRLMVIFPKIYTGNNDLSYFFIYRSLKALSKKGILAFVLPKYFIQSVYAKKIRNFINKSSEIVEIHDFTNIPVFINSNVSIVVLILRNHRLERNYSFRYFKYRKIRGSVAKVDFKICSSNLNCEKWLLFDKKLLEVLKKIKNVSNKMLLDIAKISKGIETGCDRIFAPEKPFFFSKELKIHQDLYKPWIKGKNIKRFLITNLGREVLYSPIYKRNSIEKNIKVMDYLNQYKSELMNRSRVSEYYLWRTGDERKTMRWDLPKIVSPYKANHNSFAIDWNGGLSSKDVVWIIPKSQYKQDFLLFLVGILNSDVLTFFALHSIKDLGGIFEFYPKQIENFPLVIPQKNDSKYENISQHSLKLMKEHNEHRRKKIEVEMNKIIYELYDLSKKDIDLIQNSLEQVF